MAGRWSSRYEPSQFRVSSCQFRAGSSTLRRCHAPSGLGTGDWRPVATHRSGRVAFTLTSHAVHHRRFPAAQRRGAAVVSRACRWAADSRLPLPPAAGLRRPQPALCQPVRDLARGRSLQVARDARQRCARTLLHRRRRALRKVPRLGRHHAAVSAQSAVSLDAPRAATLFRHRRAARRAVGAGDLEGCQRSAALGRVERPRHPAEVRRACGLHDRRSGRSARAP